ncbi:MAG: V-type ATP synthase subunit A, partial [Pseudomonadota bacterium]
MTAPELMQSHALPLSQARIIAVQDDIVTLEAVAEEHGLPPLRKNEVIYILPERQADGRQERLQGEILRIRGDCADAQIFESTRGVGVGDIVELTGAMLSVTLGPGLLGQVYDGLQNPLEEIATEFGHFLPRGVALPALNSSKKWAFAPKARIGARLSAGQCVGVVQEGRFTHKIMIQFDEPGEVEVEWIQEGSVTTEDPVARIRDAEGEIRMLTLQQRWPVRRPIAEALMRSGHSRRLYPDRPLVTTLRLIDSFFPIAQGGTACIPGPFGAGKTVLQQLISRNSTADIVIIVACGERAGEVVETITEFPTLSDPQTGGALMDRTIIICNTSSMPVAAREASIYTGITLGEYYRQMGYNVLLLADSTSRWAQAMRETSG